MNMRLGCDINKTEVLSALPGYEASLLHDRIVAPRVVGQECLRYRKVDLSRQRIANDPLLVSRIDIDMLAEVRSKKME